MYWKLDNLGSLLQDYCKEGNLGFSVVVYLRNKARLAQIKELEDML